MYPLPVNQFCGHQYVEQMYPLPVNQFCGHQYVEQSTSSPSTSSVVINMSNKVPPTRQPVP